MSAPSHKVAALCPFGTCYRKENSLSDGLIRSKTLFVEMDYRDVYRDLTIHDFSLHNLSEIGVTQLRDMSLTSDSIRVADGVDSFLNTIDNANKS